MSKNKNDSQSQKAPEMLQDVAFEEFMAQHKENKIDLCGYLKGVCRRLLANIHIK